MMRRTDVLMVAGAAILLAQAAASYTLTREPFLPSPPNLSALPLRLENWNQVRDGVIEPEVLEVLGPDDILSRDYRWNNSNRGANLFVAYYKSQLRSKTAHDPKVCLPGAGWNPRESHLVTIPVPGSDRTFVANYYRISRGSDESVVLYWFQTHKGIYTFEQQLRFHRILDAILDDRTDMALVRIVVPVGTAGVGAADSDARQLAQLMYPQMIPYFPVKEKAGS